MAPLEEASLTVNTRHNFLQYDDPRPEGRTPDQWQGWQGLESSGAPYWEQAGHEGTYTCNPMTKEREGGYRILARGRYKYDQTVWDPYALADAECATGFQPGPDGSPNLYIPHEDRYQIETTGHGTEWDPYGVEWKPLRFAFSNSGDASPDRLDLRLDLRTRTYVWKPLYPRNMLSADPHVRGDSRCSDGLDHDPNDNDDAPDHIYVLDPDPSTAEIEPYVLGSEDYPAEPMHFSIVDLVNYREWENCGNLQVKIDPAPSNTSIAEIGQSFESGTLSFPAPPAQQCAWWAPDQAAWIETTDHTNPGNGPVLARRLVRSVTDETPPNPDRIRRAPYEYRPRDAPPTAPAVQDMVVRPLSRTVASVHDPPSTPLPVGTVFRFTNRDTVPHTMTAKVDVDGEDCFVRVNDQETIDQCGEIKGRPRFFDSSPGCVDGRPVIGDCIQREQTWHWTINPSSWTQEFRTTRCSNGSCVVPYYCKILSHELMEGVLVIRDE